MDNIPILGHGDEKHVRNQFLGHYDAPAYVRRARGVQEAFDRLVSRCREQRDHWLPMVKLRLGVLGARAGQWSALQPWLADAEQIGVLERLHNELSPQLRIHVEPTSAPRVLRRTLAELSDSIDCFNRRWQIFLQEV